MTSFQRIPRAMGSNERTHSSSVVILVFCALLLSAAGCSGPPKLATIVHGGDGPPTLVLLHGYGSSAERWMPFTQTIRWPATGRFVFPVGPERTGLPGAPTDARTWFPLDLASHIPPGKSIPDLSGTRLVGLKSAASLVEEVLRYRKVVPRGPLVLGGFSQGAMVASEVAFRTKVPLSAVIVLSGTLVDEPSWERHFGERQNLRVFIAHGRRDTVLPFELAVRFQQKLQASGISVTWVPFDGGHEIPAVVVIALNDFLDNLQLPR